MLQCLNKSFVFTRFEVFVTVKFYIVIWVMKPCSLVDCAITYRPFSYIQHINKQRYFNDKYQLIHISAPECHLQGVYEHKDLEFEIPLQVKIVILYLKIEMFT
jgi:hypothetical protein